MYEDTAELFLAMFVFVVSGFC